MLLIQLVFRSVFRFGLSPYEFLAFGLMASLFPIVFAIPLLVLGFWYLRDVDKLKTAKGYEEWLKRTEEIARKREGEVETLSAGLKAASYVLGQKFRTTILDPQL